MKTCILFTIFSLFFSIISCSKANETEIITIEPYLKLTYGAFFKQLVLNSNESSTDFVKGFEFEWGYFYTLKVEKTRLIPPPQDASNIEYRLIEILSKTKAPEDYAFTMRLERDFYLGPGEQVNNFKKINDSLFTYFDTIQIEIPENLRDDFNDIIDKGTNMTGHFTFLTDKTILLVKLEN